MIKVKNRFCAALLSSTILFSTVCVDYIQVQAFEWVVPSLTVGESLLWLMGLLGMTYTEGASAWRDVSPEYEQEFIDYANEHGLTYTETSTWLNDAASGKLNQLSDVWINFKEWVKSLSSNASLEQFTTKNATAVMLSSLNKQYSEYFTIGNSDVVCHAAIIYPDSSYYTNVYHRGYYFYDDVNLQITEEGQVYIISAIDGSNFSYSYIDSIGTNSNGYISRISLVSSSVNVSEVRIAKSVFENTLSSYFGFSTALDIPNSIDVSSNVADSDLTIYNPALIPNINFANANTEDASIPGVIDLPWGNLGDDEEERDKTYDDLVGGLDLGQEIGDLWQALQDLMGVLAVDDAGVLQPNDGGENPPTLEDAAENNKANAAFVIPGLEKLFPFCIPFDIYAFITLLVAEPVAPVFRFPIRNPATGSDEYITIDLSEWDSIMNVIRLAEDFLFIIGMLLMARALIGGGDSA